MVLQVNPRRIICIFLSRVLTYFTESVVEICLKSELDMANRDSRIGTDFSLKDNMFEIHF